MRKLSVVFTPVVSEVALSPNVLLNAQVNHVGEGVLAVLETFSLHPYGACEGCVKNRCASCGAGGLYARVTFAPLEGDRFVTRLWAPQVAPLARYSRSQLILTWRTAPAELDARLQTYIGLPFLLAGLTLRVQGATTHAVARLTCIPWEIVRGELSARQAKKEAEERAAREALEAQQAREALQAQLQRERQIAREQARVRPRIRPARTYVETNPEQFFTNLDPQIRNFYKENWGFDPITDRLKPTSTTVDYGFQRRGSIQFYYEAEIPLEADPELTAAGVSMRARVEVLGPGEPHNRLLFIRGGRSKGVECIHTIIHAAPLDDLAQLTKADYSEMVQTTPSQPANIPPWEHFAALKSFAGGLAAAGILTVLLPESLGRQDQEPAPLEMNSALMQQLREALQTVASDVIREREMVMQGSLIEQAPEDWLRQRWPLLQKAYGVNAVFNNPPLLTSLDTETQLKLLRIFLSFTHSKIEHVVKVGANFLPVVLTPANIQAIKDTPMLQNAMFAICVSWGKHVWVQHGQVPRLIVNRMLEMNPQNPTELKILLEIIKSGAPKTWQEHHLPELVQEYPVLEGLLDALNNSGSNSPSI